VTGCDRQPATSSVAPPAQSQPAQSQPQPEQVASEQFDARLAALRHLIADQPHAADRAEYAAYLVKGEAASKLAASSSAAADPAGPPVVAALDVYSRKGRTMDRATGRPVKVFQVRLPGAVRPDGTAEAVASWRASRLAGESFRYRLRKKQGDWVVEGRSREGQ
jgi:hypothetical protein